MTYTPLLVVILAFVVVTGFSLQDSQSYDSLLSALSALPDQAAVEDQTGYTSTLQRDLEGLVGSPSLSRVSRRVRRNTENYPVCCGSGENRKITEEMKKTYPECHLENIPGSGEPDKRSNFSDICDSAQCLAKKIGVVDEEGYVLTVPYVEAIKKWYTEDSLKTLVERLAPDCVTKANAHAKEMMVRHGRELKCNIATMTAYRCIRLGVFQECPEDLQVKDDPCDEFRQRMKEWKNREKN